MVFPSSLEVTEGSDFPTGAEYLRLSVLGETDVQLQEGNSVRPGSTHRVNCLRLIAVASQRGRNELKGRLLRSPRPKV